MLYWCQALAVLCRSFAIVRIGLKVSHCLSWMGDEKTDNSAFCPHSTPSYNGSIKLFRMVLDMSHQQISKWIILIDELIIWQGHVKGTEIVQVCFLPSFPVTKKLIPAWCNPLYCGFVFFFERRYCHAYLEVSINLSCLLFLHRIIIPSFKVSRRHVSTFSSLMSNSVPRQHCYEWIGKIQTTETEKKLNNSLKKAVAEANIVIHVQN